MTLPGGWNWWMDPRAIRYGAKTWVGYVDGTTGDVGVVEYPGSATIIEAAFEADDHACPALHRLSDGTLLAVYSKHSGNVRMALSTNPDDASAWETPSTVATGSYSYPQLYETSDGLRLYLRDGDASSANLVRADWGGSSFGSPSTEFTAVYTKMRRLGDRIDVAFTRSPPAGSGSRLRHGYLIGAQWYQSDGSTVTPTADTDFDVVSSDDRPRAYDMAHDASGNPVIVYQHYATYVSDSRYKYARWTGSAWDVNEIVAAGGHIGDPVGVNVGGACLDLEDPSTVYLSKLVSGTWQMFRYRTSDGGSTWTSAQLTSAAADQLRPIVPTDRAGYRPAFWLGGQWDALDDFDLDLIAHEIAAPSSLAGSASAWPSLRP